MSDIHVDFKFVGKISAMGTDRDGEENLIIWVPKEFRSQAKKLKGKSLRVYVTDEL